MSVSTKSPTEQQQAIHRWVVDGKGNAVVIARAGTGKTSVALDGIPLMMPASSRTISVTMAMFNADIAAETRGKLAAAGLRADAKTFHSAGWSAMKKAYPKCKMTGTGTDQAGVNKWDLIVEKLDMPLTYQSFAHKAMSMAKQRAFGLIVRMSDPAAWLKIVDDFDLDALIGAEYLDSGLRPRNEIIKEGLQWAFKALKASNEMLDTILDFDDQIYGPLIRDLKLWESDWLIVDEAQDTNPARRLLARKMVKATGRTLWIGDPLQSIYAFTGADGDAMDIIIKEWDAKIFKLTKTFRCPKIVVKMVQQLYVPDFEAGPNNIEGEYLDLANDDFYKTQAATLSSKSVFLCRNTAPLVKSAFRLLGMGVACYVEGKDIGSEIVSLVNRWKSVKTLHTLTERLKAYLETQTEKLNKAGKERQAESLNDRVETVFAVIEGLDKGATLDDLKAKVDVLFQKTPKGERPDRIRLMTIHRAKGLEAPTIVFLGRRELIPSKFAKTEEQIGQEDNLAYVGLTRVQEKLIEVRI